MGLTLQILGPVRACRDGRWLRLPAGRPTALLVVLLLQSGTPVPVERLREELWGGRPPASAVANLRSHASQLRRLLAVPGEPPRLRAEGGGYLLRTGPGELDAAEFERLTAEGLAAQARGAVAHAVDRLGRALALWSSDTPPPAYGPGTAAAFDRLRERRAVAREAYAACRLELGDPGSAELRSLLGEHLVENPLRETGWALLMSAEQRAGDRAAALRTYRRACRALAGELGVAPGPELTARYRAVVRAAPGSRPDTRRPVDRVPTVPHELPYPLGPFVGRHAELAQLGAALARTRDRPVLLSVHGTAGAGKSALALRAATAALDAFPDGQLHLDLGGSVAGEPLPPRQVADRVLRALNPASDPEPTTVAEAQARVRSALFGRRVLLMLDNAAGPTQVDGLLPARGGCALLVTGRARLPDGHGPALRLDPLPPCDGLALLRALVGDRRVDGEPAAAAIVVALCEGLPRALRAAARRLGEGGSLARLARLLRAERCRLAGAAHLHAS
ncbi:AfsR/SARP family transcriptional regulator [Micromonospora sp. AMSO31t]|uniref:AfsR/SARP family transcriptional regulator n=1 Tax=Micromonospora sp. AMSO31t TaxID=2650566 RepID=UPI001788DD0D|nr:AfsR/SARP family transcriptional regulator [Micromonospora sp. AMSO31t]